MKNKSSCRQGIVASGHPQVSCTAVEILRAGGNAFDAAIAAGFVSALAEPALTSLGGGGFLLAHSAGKSILFDFFSDTPGMGLPETSLSPRFFPLTVKFPGSSQIFNIGQGSVAVPGNLRGYLHVHRRLGRLPLSEILAPAIYLGRHGILVNSRQALFLDYLKPIMTLTERGKNLYRDGTSYLEQGRLFVNLDMASFLECLITEGDRPFYEGEIARAIALEMQADKGLLTELDLSSYQVIERQPLALDYGGMRLLTNPLPSFGGALIVQALEILKQTGLQEFSWGETEHILALAETMRQVDLRRQKEKGGPEKLDFTWTGDIGRQIRLFCRGTTHLSIADADGNVASMSTSNGEGSGYIAPGTGIMLNNMMGEDDLHPGGFHSSPPGIRVSSMMSPTIALRDGQPIFALGSGGSKRIRTAILQVLINLLDFKMDVQSAVLAPRLHWDGEILQMEPGFSSRVRKRLEEIYKVNVWGETNMYFGGVHAIADGLGCGDPRRGGDSRCVSFIADADKGF